MAHYEIEVKSLLGDKKNADALRKKMRTLDPESTCVSKHKQLNHYFKDGNISILYDTSEHLFDADAKIKFNHIIEKGNSFSIRTRQKDDIVLLVVKASMDTGTSENTISRLEFEEPVAIPLSELDTVLEGAGFAYQAKWSRAREEYAYKGANVCLDCNAGYGYLAEFEKVVEDEHGVEQARKDIDTLMAELGVVELPQDRLERMFAHYNKHWPQYYGTDKVFVIE